MVTTESNGKVAFRVFLPHAAKVELLGDFTDWRSRPIPMTRQNPGWWTVELELEPGDHTFGYLVDGSVWLADYAAHGVKLSGYGGWVSRVVVDPPHATSARPPMAIPRAAVA
jgi:1,4-alpha-glucan branching enzyme